MMHPLSNFTYKIERMFKPACCFHSNRCQNYYLQIILCDPWCTYTDSVWGVSMFDCSVHEGNHIQGCSGRNDWLDCFFTGQMAEVPKLLLWENEAS